MAHHADEKVFLAAALVTESTEFAFAGDPAAGEQTFKICLPCHSIGEGAKNKIGPQLNGINGRHSGTVSDYSYSDANKNSGITWNEQNVQGIHQRSTR